MGKAILVPNVTFSNNLGKVTSNDYPYNGLELVKVNNQPPIGRAAQGVAIYGNYIFTPLAIGVEQIEIRDMLSGNVIQTVTVQENVGDRHGNSMVFGHLKYNESDEFPLLYGGGNLNSLINTIDVYHVTRTNGVFSIAHIQTIDTSICNSYVDVAYWNDKLVLCGAKEFIVNPPTTLLSEYTLTSGDIIKQFNRKGASRQYVQQSCVWNNCLYMPLFDTFTSKGTYDFMMKVINLNTEEVCMDAEFNYNNNYGIEFEAVFVWNENLYAIVGFNVYKILLIRS